MGMVTITNRSNQKVKGWDLDVEVQASFHSSQDTAEKRFRRNIKYNHASVMLF